jgi:hypothetical protein
MAELYPTESCWTVCTCSEEVIRCGRRPRERGENAFDNHLEGSSLKRYSNGGTRQTASQGEFLPKVCFDPRHEHFRLVAHLLGLFLLYCTGHGVVSCQSPPESAM